MAKFQSRDPQTIRLISRRKLVLQMTDKSSPWISGTADRTNGESFDYDPEVEGQGFNDDKSYQGANYTPIICAILGTKQNISTKEIEEEIANLNIIHESVLLANPDDKNDGPDFTGTLTKAHRQVSVTK